MHFCILRHVPGHAQQNLGFDNTQRFSNDSDADWAHMFSDN